MSLLLFIVCAVGGYYLLARASITQWLWLPLDEVPFVGPLLRCPACTGTWLGVGLSFWHPLYDRDPGLIGAVDHVLVHAFAGMVVTAIGWGLMKLALDYGGVHVDPAGKE